MPNIKPPTQKKDKKNPVFTVSVGDVQCVAVNEFNRMLSDKEIERLRDCIVDTIPWYDSVLTAIDDHIINKNSAIL